MFLLFILGSGLPNFTKFNDAVYVPMYYIFSHFKYCGFYDENVLLSSQKMSLTKSFIKFMRQVFHSTCQNQRTYTTYLNNIYLHT